MLGPLLFLIMIQDIDERILHSFLSSFDDDTRLIKEIKNLADIIKLQEDTPRIISKWNTSTKSKLLGKTKNSKIIQSRKTRKIPDYLYLEYLRKICSEFQSL